MTDENAGDVVHEEVLGWIHRRTQIEVPAVGVLKRAVPHHQAHIAEADILHGSRKIAIEQDAVFAFGVDVGETDVRESAHLVLHGGALDHRYVDRLAVAPPISGMQTCLDGHVREMQVVDRSVLMHEHSDAAVRPVDLDVVEADIPHAVLVDAADANTGRARLEDAVRDGDVF